MKPEHTRWTLNDMAEIVAEDGHSIFESLEDATLAETKLALAAPDLLAACKDALQLLDECSMGGHVIALALHAAIAKAEGGEA